MFLKKTCKYIESTQRAEQWKRYFRVSGESSFLAGVHTFCLSVSCQFTLSAVTVRTCASKYIFAYGARASPPTTRTAVVHTHVCTRAHARMYTCCSRVHTRKYVSHDDPRKALVSGEHSSESFLEKIIYPLSRAARVSAALRLKERGENEVVLEEHY